MRNVSPRQDPVLDEERIRTFVDDGQDRYSGLLGEGECPGLEAVYFAVLGACAFGKYGYRSAAPYPLRTFMDNLSEGSRRRAVDADVAVQDEVLPEEWSLEDFSFGYPSEVERQPV